MVGHDVREVHAGPGRHQGPEVYFTFDELAGLLGSDWRVEVGEMRQRPPDDPHGHDLVFRARRE